MTDQAKSIRRPWRRFLRFSVRGLIVLVLMIGVWLGWIVRSARIQREAVAAITSAGSWVEYDSEWESRKSNPGEKPVPRGWLVGLLGIDYFGQVTAVTLQSTPIDATFVHIGNLTLIKEMNLSAFVSDAELAHLKGLTNLSYLCLGGNRISDAGLAHLKSLTTLERLSIGSSRVSDAGLAHLEALTNLTVLDLSYTAVTDAGLAHLKGLARLRYLYVNETRVTDAGLKELQQALPNLKIEH